MADAQFTIDLAPRDYLGPLRLEEHDARFHGDFARSDAYRQYCDHIERTNEWPAECEWRDRGIGNAELDDSWLCGACGCTEPEEVTGVWRCSACGWSVPECTCYEMIGGHQPGCPLAKRVAAEQQRNNSAPREP